MNLIKFWEEATPETAKARVETYGIGLDVDKGSEHFGSTMLHNAARYCDDPGVIRTLVGLRAAAKVVKKCKVLTSHELRQKYTVLKKLPSL